MAPFFWSKWTSTLQKSDARRVDCRPSCWAFLEIIAKKPMLVLNNAAQPAVKLELHDNARTLPDVVAGFLESVSSGRAFAVDIPLPSVGSSSSHLDLADDFLDASLIAERMGALATRRSMSWAKVRHLNVIRLELDGYEPQAMALELARMAIFLDYPNLETDGLRDEYERVWEPRHDYEDSLEQSELLFPEIADHYFGNLVMSYGEWDDPESLRVHLQRHPERRYGFFVTRSIRIGGRGVLSSDGELILPSDAPLTDVLESVGYGGEALLPARMVMTEQEASFIGDHVVVGVPSEIVTQAMACGDEFVRRTQSDSNSYDLVAFRGRVVGADDEPSARPANGRPRLPRQHPGVQFRRGRRGLARARRAPDQPTCRKARKPKRDGQAGARSSRHTQSRRARTKPSGRRDYGIRASSGCRRRPVMASALDDAMPETAARQ